MKQINKKHQNYSLKINSIALTKRCVMDINDNTIKFIVSADELFKEITERKDHSEYHITIINVLSSPYFEDCRIKDSINIEA